MLLAVERARMPMPADGNREPGTRDIVVLLQKTAFKMGSWLMRGVLLWLLGLPIPIIILLYVFHVI